MFFKKNIFLYFIIWINSSFAQFSTIELKSDGKNFPIGFKELDSNFSICVSNSSNNGNCIIVVTKLNKSKEIIWSKAYNSQINTFNIAYSFIIDRDKNIIIVGAVLSQSAFIMKVNSNNGNIIFNQAFVSNSNSDRIIKIYQMEKGFSDDYVVLGTLDYPYNYFVSRITNTGNLVWSKQYDIPSDYELAYCLNEGYNNIIYVGLSAFNQVNYDHSIMRIDPSNGSNLGYQRFDLGYGNTFNGAMDEGLSIHNTNYIVYSFHINGNSNPTRQGILIYDTKNLTINNYQLYDLGESARSTSLSYNYKSNKIYLGGAYSNSNNAFFQVIEFNDLTKCQTFRYKNINYQTQASGTCNVYIDSNGINYLSSFLSSTQNLNVSNILLSNSNETNQKCLEKTNTSIINFSLPNITYPSISSVNTQNLYNYTFYSDNFSYTITTLCQDDCIPVKKLFGISTPKSQDSICYITSYQLPIAITHNTLATPILFKLYKKQNAAYLLVDSVLSLNNIVFNIAYTQAAEEYRVIAVQKCSYNDTVSFKLIKYQLVAAAPNNLYYICQKESITLHSGFNYNGTKAINYTWLDSALNSQIGNADSITLIPTKNQTVYLQANAFCAQPISTKTWIYVAPIVADSSIVAFHNGCSPHIDTLLHPHSIASSNEYSPFNWQWYIGANAFINTPSVAGKVEDNIEHLFPNAGKYTVRVNMELPNSKKCKTYIDTIRVWQSAEAQFKINPHIIDMGDKEVQFINQSQNAIGYQWMVNDTSFYTSHSPLHILKREGNFNVTLIAIGEKQCNDTIVKTLTINEQYNIMLPSAFSPNNDGINTLWVPYFSGMANLEMQIFNRWGELLYNCTGNCAWDGKYKGELCEDGVYLYLLKVKSKKQQTYIYKGTLHLLH